MIFQHKDGELRILEHGYTGVTRYVEVLFSDANITGPVGRAQTEELLKLNRGILDSDGHYVESGDAGRLEPLTLTFSCRAADTRHSQVLVTLLSGQTGQLNVGGATFPIRTRKGVGRDVYGLSTAPPVFKDSSHKTCYLVQVLYSGTSNWGMEWDEVYFPPAEQSVTESEDALTLNLTGMIYGGVSKITSFAGTNAM